RRTPLKPLEERRVSVAVGSQEWLRWCWRRNTSGPNPGSPTECPIENRCRVGAPPGGAVRSVHPDPAAGTPPRSLLPGDPHMNIVQPLVEQKLISPPHWLASNLHYLTIMGSVAYGVADTTSEEETSDFDLYGFCIPPRDIVFPYTAGAIWGCW